MMRTAAPAWLVWACAAALLPLGHTHAHVVEGRLLQVDTFTVKRHSLHWINWVRPRHTHKEILLPPRFRALSHTRKPAKDTAHKTIFQNKFFVFSLVKHTDMASAAHIGYSIMHSRLRQPVVSTPRAHGSNLQAGLNTIVHSCITASTTPFEPTRKADPTWWQPQVPLPQSLTRPLRLLLMGLPYVVGKPGMS
jgi:hypothetical protein